MDFGLFLFQFSDFVFIKAKMWLRNRKFNTGVIISSQIRITKNNLQIRKNQFWKHGIIVQMSFVMFISISSHSTIVIHSRVVGQITKIAYFTQIVYYHKLPVYSIQGMNIKIEIYYIRMYYIDNKKIKLPIKNAWNFIIQTHV